MQHIVLSRKKSLNLLVSGALVAATAMLSSCGKPLIYDPIVAPFQHLSVTQYRNLVAKLRAAGVKVIKQGSSVQLVMSAKNLFYANTLELGPGQAKVLYNVATLVKHAPSSSIQVIGYSSYLPTVRDQYKQSHQMAAVVAAQLWRFGVPTTQKLKIEAMADKNPVSGSLTAKGNVQNQRVEVRIN